MVCSALSWLQVKQIQKGASGGGIEIHLEAASHGTRSMSRDSGGFSSGEPKNLGTSTTSLEKLLHLSYTTVCYFTGLLCLAMLAMLQVNPFFVRFAGSEGLSRCGRQCMTLQIAKQPSNKRCFVRVLTVHSLVMLGTQVVWDKLRV